MGKSTRCFLWNPSSLLFAITFSQYRITLFSNQSSTCSMNKCIYFYSTLGIPKCQIKLKLSAIKCNAKLNLLFCPEHKILNINNIVFSYSFSNYLSLSFYNLYSHIFPHKSFAHFTMTINVKMSVASKV